MEKIIFIILGIVVWWACEDGTDSIVGEEGVMSEFTDPRDGKVYKSVTIGNQTWMAENLAYRLPMGNLEGCYTYKEDVVDTNKIWPEDNVFYSEVEKALEDKKFSDKPLPESPILTPVSIIQMFMGAPVSEFMSMMQSYVTWFPSMQPTVEILEGIQNRLKREAIINATEQAMQKAEDLTGGYKDTYGLLYTYEGALKALPEGWRLPTDEDWKKLEETLGMNQHELNLLEEWRGTTAGILLHDSKTGFSIKYAGVRAYGLFNYDSPYMNKGVNAYYWSSSCITRTDSTKVAIIRTVSRLKDGILRGTSNMTAAYSIRGIKE